MGGSQARYQLRHHLRKTLALPGVRPDQVDAASTDRRPSYGSSSRSAWALCITVIAWSQVKALRVERAIYATLPCRKARSPGLLICPVAGSEVPGAGSRRAARATDRAGAAGLVVSARSCTAAASSRRRFPPSARARWSVSRAHAVPSPAAATAACASATVADRCVSSASAVARASPAAGMLAR